MPDWIKGIDVSVHQGVIDWQKVKDSGIAFAFLKTSEGVGFEDPSWRRNRDGCNRFEIPWSGYHFARPDSTIADAVNEARWFKSLGGHEGPLPPVLDLESTTMGREQTIVWADDFCNELTHPSGIDILYAGAFWLGSAIAADPRLRSCIWWLPNYGANADNPPIPSRWITATNNPVGEQADVWQYSSRGKVPGIGNGRSDVDMNIMERSLLASLMNNEGEDMTPGDCEEVVKRVLADPTGTFATWTADSRKTIALIIDGRTGKRWAVWGLFKMEFTEPYTGWWALRKDVADFTVLGPQTTGLFVSMVDETAEVRRGEGGRLLVETGAEVNVDTADFADAVTDALVEGVLDGIDGITLKRP